MNSCRINFTIYKNTHLKLENTVDLYFSFNSVIPLSISIIYLSFLLPSKMTRTSIVR